MTGRTKRVPWMGLVVLLALFALNGLAVSVVYAALGDAAGHVSVVGSIGGWVVSLFYPGSWL